MNDELATVMFHPNMEMWNLSHVELFFLEQAYSDWDKWDMIGEVCFGLDEHSMMADIQGKILEMPLEETFTLDVIQGMQDCINSGHFQATGTPMALDSTLHF